MEFNKKEYERLFNMYLRDGRIRKSNAIFKIKLFLQKSESSLLIAKYIKDFKPSINLPKKMYWDYWAITISYYSMLYAAKAVLLSKGYEVKGHDPAQIALGHLLVPSEIEKEDLELLNQSYKIFEDEYIKYFEDAKKESKIARYRAIKTYTERRLDEIFNNATKFIAKIALILEDIKNV